MRTKKTDTRRATPQGDCGEEDFGDPIAIGDELLKEAATFEQRNEFHRRLLVFYDDARWLKEHWDNSSNPSAMDAKVPLLINALVERKLGDIVRRYGRARPRGQRADQPNSRNGAIWLFRSEGLTVPAAAG